MIIKTEGKLGEGMSYKSLLFGELRSGGGRTYWDVSSILEKREKFLRSSLHRSLSPAQAQRVLNAVLEENPPYQSDHNPTVRAPAGKCQKSNRGV